MFKPADVRQFFESPIWLHIVFELSATRESLVDDLCKHGLPDAEAEYIRGQLAQIEVFVRSPELMQNEARDAEIDSDRIF